MKALTTPDDESNKANKTAGSKIYGEIIKRRKLILTVMIVCAVLGFFINISLGPMKYTLWEVIRTIIRPDSSPLVMRLIIWDYRMPEAIMALLVGAALAMAGAEMQTILDNPLAEPYTLGISASAAFGAALAIVLGIGVGSFGSYTTAINAFLFALLSCTIIYLMMKFKSADKYTMILTGVALLFLFQALVSVLQVTSSKEGAMAVMFWMFGSLGNSNWLMVAIVSVVCLLVGMLFFKNTWKLTSLKLGDSKASSLGVDVARLRKKMLLGISLLTAVAVCFTGVIGFVGLVGPHIARMLVGEDQRYFLPVSALSGALFLTVAAIISKSVSLASVLPIGIVTSLIGVPIFLFMILGKKKVMA